MRGPDCGTAALCPGGWEARPRLCGQLVARPAEESLHWYTIAFALALVFGQSCASAAAEQVLTVTQAAMMNDGEGRGAGHSMQAAAMQQQSGMPADMSSPTGLLEKLILYIMPASTTLQMPAQRLAVTGRLPLEVPCCAHDVPYNTMHAIVQARRAAASQLYELQQSAPVHAATTDLSILARFNVPESFATRQASMCCIKHAAHVISWRVSAVSCDSHFGKLLSKCLIVCTTLLLTAGRAHTKGYSVYSVYRSADLYKRVGVARVHVPLASGIYLRTVVIQYHDAHVIVS